MAETAYERFLKDTTKDEAVEIDIKDKKPIDLDEIKFKIQETLTEQTGDIVLQDQKQDIIDPEEDEGYYDQDDFAADGEENEDNLSDVKTLITSS